MGPFCIVGAHLNEASEAMAAKILGASPVVRRTIRVPIGKNEAGDLIEVEMRPTKFGRLIEIDKEIPEPMAPSTGEKSSGSGAAAERRHGVPSNGSGPRRNATASVGPGATSTANATGVSLSQKRSTR